jgi:hypothetical protein
MKNSKLSIECEKAVHFKTPSFSIENEKGETVSVSLDMAKTFMKFLSMLLPHKRSEVQELPITNQLLIADSTKFLDAEFVPVPSKEAELSASLNSALSENSSLKSELEASVSKVSEVTASLNSALEEITSLKATIEKNAAPSGEVK